MANVLKLSWMFVISYMLDFKTFVSQVSKYFVVIPQFQLDNMFDDSEEYRHLSAMSIYMMIFITCENLNLARYMTCK